MKKLFLAVLLFAAGLFANNEKLAIELADIAAPPLYNINNAQAQINIKPFFKTHPEVWAVVVKDSIDNSTFIRAYKKNKKIIFGKSIPQALQRLQSSTATVIYESERIGEVKIYYKELYKVELSKKESRWIAEHNVAIGAYEFSPLIFTKSNTNIDGISSDYLKKIQTITSLKYKIKVGKKEHLLRMVSTGLVDIVPAVSQHESKNLLFSNPYFTLKSYLYVEEKSTANSFLDLRGKKVAVTQNNPQLKELKEVSKDLQVVVVSNLDDAIALLQKGEVAAIFEAKIVMEKKLFDEYIEGIKRVNQERIKAERLCFALAPNNTILLEIINKALQVMPPREKNKIVAKWFAINQEIQLTPDEVAWLVLDKPLRYTYDPNWRPLGYANRIKEYKGIVADILQLVEQKSGLKIKTIYSSSWKKAIIKTKAKKADALCTSQLKEGLDHLDFSKKALVKTPFVFVSKQTKEEVGGFEKLKHKKLALFQGSTIVDPLKKDHPELNTILLNNREQGLLALQNNKFDVLILNAIVARYYLNKKSYSDLNIVYKTPYNLDLKLAVRKGFDKEALSIFDKAMAHVSEREINDIIDKWTIINIKKETDWTLLFEVVAALLVIVLFVLWSNSRLNKMVKEKTKILSKQKNELEELSQSLEKKVQHQTEDIRKQLEIVKTAQQKQEELNKELNRQKSFVETVLNSQEQIILTTDGSTLVSVNKAFLNFFNVDSIEHFENKYKTECVCDLFGKKDGFLQKKMDGLSWINYIIANTSLLHKVALQRDDYEYIYSVTGVQITKESNLKLAVFTNITLLEEAKKEVEAIHKQTRESIEYASLIQSALIPEYSSFRGYFKDYFTIWHPKDTVGGDIYLFEHLTDDDALLMVIDCTGHGVPGAFVTMLVKAIERQIVSFIKHNDEVVSPAKLLGIFNKSMKHLLRQDNENSISNAGFDGGILYYNKKQKFLRYAGANTPLFYVQDKKLHMLKGDRYSVGYKKCSIEYQYTEHQLPLEEGMSFYLTTDGYIDQNGGEKGFPFGKRRFKALIEEYYHEDMADQQEIFLEALAEYEDGYERNDDITVIGFKV